MSPDEVPGPAGRAGAVRPVVALVAAPGTTAPLRPLVAALARRAVVTTWGREPDPDVVLLSHPSVAEGPVAGRRGAVVEGDSIWVLGPDGSRVGKPIPRPGAHVVDSASRPPIPPHVRDRWRQRLGLAPDLVVDTIALDPVDVPTALAVAAAAVVELRHLPEALALGCPTVTDAGAAAAVGALPGHDLLVGDRSDALALASDPQRAATLSSAGRDFAVARLDPAVIADALLERWGVGAYPSPAVRIAAALAELGTAPGSPVRSRAADAVALFAPP